MGSSQLRDRTQVSHIASRFFTVLATREAQEYWSGLPFPSPGDLPDPGIEPSSPALQADSLPSEPPEKLKKKGREAQQRGDICIHIADIYIYASLVAQLVKNPPAMQETLLQFLGQEDPLEKEMATHSSILA